MTTRAAVYCRISSDRDGDGAGVARQEVDCRALAERRGWPVGEVFIDNDVSAYSGRTRPSYRRMLAAIKAGEINAVVVWHLDRLHRQPKELEEFFDVCDAAGVKDLASVTGDVDLSSHDGRFMARILGAVARKESDDKSRRTKRKHLELAQAGSPVGGGRPFGFEDDRVTIRPGEAALIREAAARVLAGETIRSVCSDWSRRGIGSVKGDHMTPTSLRRVLTGPRWAGHRTLGRGGEIVARNAWPAIIDDATLHQLRGVLLDRARRMNSGFGARSYLLTGFLYCGKCGTRMVARAMQPKSAGAASHRRSYVCSSGPNHHGCGGIRIIAEPLEELLTEMVLIALDSDELHRAMKRSDAPSPATDLVGEIQAAEAKLAELARDWAEDQLSRAEWMAARGAVEQRRERARTRLAEQTRTTALDGLTGAVDLRDRWAALGLDRRRVVIAAVIDRITIGAARRGVNKFDPNRVAPVWRY